MHGGTVTVESAVGQGRPSPSRSPSAPRTPAERIGAGRAAAPTALGAAPFVQEALRWSAGAEPPGPGRPTRRGRAARILVADDNADMRDYIARLLGERYAVEAVADGAAALARGPEAPPDLILTDVMMPGLDGWGCSRALRADERTRASRSSSCRPAPARSRASRGSTRAPTTTWSSRSRRASCSPASPPTWRARASAGGGARPGEALLAVHAGAGAGLRRSGPELVYDLANPLYDRMVGRSDLVGKPIREAFPELPADAPVFAMLEGV